MMSGVRPLWYFGQPTRQQMENLRLGKQLLGADFLIVPKHVTEESIGIAMAFEDPGYPYLSGFAYVGNAKTPEQFRNALAAIYFGEYADHIVTPGKWLSRILGEVIEHDWEDQE